MALPSRIIVGAFKAGSIPLDGTIRNMRVRSSLSGQAVASWQHDGVTEDHGHRLVVVVDGEAFAVLPAGSTEFSLAGIPAGEHTLDVVPVRQEVRGLPEFHGRPYGRRAWLRWPAATSSDCASYAIYSDGGTGTVDTDVPVAVVSGYDVHPRFFAPPDTGSGTGRLTVVGAYLGTARNSLVTVEILSATTFRHNLTGLWSGAITFTVPGSVEIGEGVLLRFEEGTPADGDEWQFRIGPPLTWLSGELAEGTYQFRVSARDAAGNESALLSAQSVAITPLPEAVSGASASWDGADIALAWSEPAEAASVRIYSNYSPVFGVLREYINEDGPLATVAAGEEAYSFTPAVAGVWQFWLRTVDAGGRENDSVELLTVDTTGAPSSVALAVPELLEVVPIAGGKFRLRFNYPLEGGLDVEEFRLYANSTNDPGSMVFATPEQTVSATGIGATGVDEITVETADPYTNGQTYYWTVRAATSAAETSNTDSLPGVADTTAPAFSGDLQGVPN